MKLLIIGHGKMGKLIEQRALELKDEIVAVIDSESDWELHKDKLHTVDVALEFSTPQTVLHNIYKCFELNIPVVVGTTGWYEQLEKVKKDCLTGHHALFFASNFSIGVQLFFEINRQMALLMNQHHQYEVLVEESHHIHKLDKPSGTATSLANILLAALDGKTKWSLEHASSKDILQVHAIRQGEIIGRHLTHYESEEDEIEIIHNAKNRMGFVNGALSAAHWLYGKTGCYEMKDMLGF